MTHQYEIREGMVITIPSLEVYSELWEDRPPSHRSIQCTNYTAILESGLRENWYTVVSNNKESICIKLIDPALVRHLLAESIISIYDVAELLENEHPFLQQINDESTSIVRQTHQDAVLRLSDGTIISIYLSDTINGVFLNASKLES